MRTWRNVVLVAVMAALAAGAGHAMRACAAGAANDIHVSAPGAIFHAHANISASLNWAGYVADAGPFTEIGGTWIIPAVTAAKDLKTDATWVGIGGAGSPDLIQAGTSAVTGVDGGVSYQAWYELLPDYSQYIPLAVGKGDSVSVLIKQSAKNLWNITLTNNSTGKHFTKRLHYASSLSSVEWVEEMPSQVTGAGSSFVPLDSFKSVAFSKGFAVRRGAVLSIAQSGAKPLAMAAATGKLLVKPSPLRTRGTGFKVTRYSVLSDPTE